MKIKKKKLFIYDLDGTLVDTRQDIIDAANHMRGKMGMYKLPDERICVFVGRGLDYLVKHCIESVDRKTVARGSKIYRKYYAQHMLDHAKLYPYARDFLDHFKTRSQVVITNKPDPFAAEILEAMHVKRHFVKIIAGNNSEYPQKPDPSSTLAMMEMAGVTPKEVIWIGDSAIDVETARAAGVEVLLMTHGFATKGEIQLAKPDRTSGSFKALIREMDGYQW